MTLLGESVVSDLMDHLAHRKMVHDEDLSNRVGSAYLPFALELLVRVFLTAHHSILDARAFLKCCMRCYAHRIHIPKTGVRQKRMMPKGLRRIGGTFIKESVSTDLLVCT